MNHTLYEIAKKYWRRRFRLEAPDGQFDRKGRWYPSKAEFADCCCTIREPSRHWPYSLLNHCRTLSHLAQRHNVDVRELRKATKAVRSEVVAEAEAYLERLTRRHQVGQSRQPGTVICGRCGKPASVWLQKESGTECLDCVLQIEDACPETKRLV